MRLIFFLCYLLKANFLELLLQSKMEYSTMFWAGWSEIISFVHLHKWNHSATDNFNPSENKKPLK